jgi:hypothetical protein
VLGLIRGCDKRIDEFESKLMDELDEKIINKIVEKFATDKALQV